MTANSIVLIVVAYLLGSLPTGYLIGRLKGVDIRERGDRYTGARNVSRELGLLAGIATGAVDVVKGAIAILLTMLLPIHPVAVILVGLAVVSGHIWPVFLRFRGGAGLATTIGVLYAALPREAVTLSIPFLVIILLTKRRYGWSLTASLFFVPLLAMCWLLQEPWYLFALPAVLGAFIGIRMYWHQMVPFLRGVFSR